MPYGPFGVPQSPRSIRILGCLQGLCLPFCMPLGHGFCLAVCHKFFWLAFSPVPGVLVCSRVTVFLLVRPRPPLYFSVPPESSVSLSSPSVFLFFPFIAQQSSPFVLLSPSILSLSPLCASKDFPFCVQRVALRSWSTPLLPR